MRAEHIEKLLSSLGCDKIRVTGSKIRSTCPLAPWKHGDGIDHHPSLAVFISDDDHSGVNCMSGRCGFHGSLSDLLYKMQRFSGRDMSAQLMFVAEHNIVNFDKQLGRIDASAGMYAMPKPKVTLPAAIEGGADYSDPVERASKSPALPEASIEMMYKMHSWIDDEAHAYLTGPDRLLTNETIDLWKLGWHPQARRISVPQHDCDRRLVNLSGRHVPRWTEGKSGRTPKWMHAAGFKRELYLFGEDKFELNPDGRGTVFIVEGGFDVIYLYQCGLRNVAGINGSNINKTQVDKILKWFDSAVMVMDGDEAGITAAKRIEATLATRMHVSVHLISDGRDPNQMTQNEVDELKKRFAS